MSSSSSSLEQIIPQLLSHLEAENYNDALSITTNLLLLHDNDDNDDDDDQKNNTSPPLLSSNFKQLIEQIHCRSLIALSKYTTLVEYYKHYHLNNKNNNSSSSRSSSSSSKLALEYVYALYKLGRYEYCRDIIQNEINNDKKNEQVVMIGMMHVLAQCQYRLHDTKDARRIYTKLLTSRPNDDDGSSNDNVEEILTNALAANISNKTFVGSCAIKPSNDEEECNYKNKDIDIDTIIEEKVCQKLQEIEQKDSDDEYLYEFVYNAATQLLLQSASAVQTKKAMEWFHIAEQKCIHEYDDDDDDEQQEDKEEAKVRNEKTNHEISQNIMPIQANIAYTKMQLGDINGSMRSYLELVLAMKKITDVEPTFNGRGGASLAIDNNLVVLNSNRSSSSVFDLMKRLPEVNQSGTTTGAGAGAAGTSRMNPNQVRTILYNRAVLYYKMNKHSECKTILNMLKHSLVVSTNDDNNSEEKVYDMSNNQSGNNNGLSKKKRSKKVKKSNGDTSNNIINSGHGRSRQSNNRATAPVESVSERILWEAKIALLENECCDAESNNMNHISNMVDRIKSEINNAEEKNDAYVLEYALADILLHEAQKLGLTKDGTTEWDDEGLTKLASTLENLPDSIRSRPAIVATLYSIYSNLSMEDQVKITLDSMKNRGGGNEQNLTEQKRLGDFKLRLGMYEDAASVYESILSQIEKGDSSLDDGGKMECEAGLMKAVSYFDWDKAIDLADKILFEVDDDLDGEQLEAMDIPRLSKGTSGSKVRKMIGRNKNAEKQKKKKNQDAILRRRSKKREAFLEKLQNEGQYNPDRPVKPDPERWVPKSQRSYNKRGRKGRTKFVGAQGIGSGAGADKDAAKLDAAARAAAKAQGKDDASNSRSTAHLAVSSTGFKGGRRR